tara:strand:+ start:26 stop:289 length:264 start_codon:yes stop_codon:yes gene_type:complete
MISANKIYKESKSKLPFKEWLKREQIKGTMQIHNNYVNANGSQDDEETAPSKTCNGGTPVWIPTLAGIALGGALVYFLLKKKKVSDS